MQEILDHKGTIQEKTEYLVRWQHYTDYWDSWEPEENVKDTQTFKRYRAVMDISSTLTQKSNRHRKREHPQHV